MCDDITIGFEDRGRYNMVGRPSDVRALIEHLNCALAERVRTHPQLLPKPKEAGVVSLVNLQVLSKALGVNP